MGWNGRRIGTVIPQMDARIASTLVKRGAAEYTGADKVIEEPVAVKKKRKRRKSNDNPGQVDNSGPDQPASGESC